MKKFGLSLLIVVFGLALNAQNELKVNEIVLNNGLTVWINEDHTQPMVFGGVAVKAGAKDCPNTGIAHYFEHIMFKGTEQIGTTDYKAEKVYLDMISEKYDQLAETKDEDERKQIQREINELSIQAAEYVIPNEFSKLIGDYSGTGLNAGTSYDFTCYFNSFLPAYLEQWLELNSERLIDPVFRMFQTELETVYEEKNMYADQLGGNLQEKLFERIFGEHPYAYPIVGSTENLKNPKLSDMRKFFEEYYVASNMCLFLCGDINTEEALPLIEKYFSRIQSGKAPEYKSIELDPFNGRETFEMLLPIPVLKMMNVIYRGPKAGDDDALVLDVICKMLTNENRTGFIDQSTTKGDFMEAQFMSMSLCDAGIIMGAIVPKIVGMSYEKAEQTMLEQINRIKRGDFTDDFLETIKRNIIQERELALENNEDRAMALMGAYTTGQTIEDLNNETKKIAEINRKLIIEIADKYFGENYLMCTKKTGNYDVERIEKPGFAPIVPKKATSRSEYAERLKSIPVRKTETRFIDFDNDVNTVALNPNVILYANENPFNDIFSLDIRFGIGTNTDPRLEYLGGYLAMLGTDTMTYEAFNNKMQKLGATMIFSAGNNYSTLTVTGPDDNLDEIVGLTAHFMTNMAADNGKFKRMVSEAKVNSMSFESSNDMVSQAMFEKVVYGDNSDFIDHLTLKKLKKVKASGMKEAFDNVQNSKWKILYCGNKNLKSVAHILNKNLPMGRATDRGGLYETKETIRYDKPLVYFYNFKDSKQCIIYNYVKGDESQLTDKDYATAKMFANYLCGDMSSILFQEIREFRSLAYNVGGTYRMPARIDNDKAGMLVTMLSTQADKTSEAMIMLDSLTRYMPVQPERMSSTLQITINDINSSYPNFRNLCSHIADLKLRGYKNDPNLALIKAINNVSIKDIKQFHSANIGGSKEIVYIVIGDKNAFNFEDLMRFGEVKELKTKDIYNP